MIDHSSAQLINAARRLKHSGFVLQKKVRRQYKATKFHLATRLFEHFERVRPYQYRPERYADTFLWHNSCAASNPSELPRQVFVIWAGNNPLTPNRERSLAAIREKIGLPVHVITPDNLGEWLAPESPLHTMYESLSLVHRSDYLRGYLMHHHGGAYVDIKKPLHSWLPSFEIMESDPECWVTSYSSTDANWIGKLRGRLGFDILAHYRLMFGKGGFIMRSHTPLTTEWLAEMNRRLDAISARLIAHPGYEYGTDPKYPLSWTDLLGRVLDPLTLKYLPHIHTDDRMLLEFKNYR